MSEHEKASNIHEQSTSRLFAELESGKVSGLSPEARSQSLKLGKRWNLEPIDIYGHAENDFSMTQYWRPVSGWEFGDSADADAQARRILFDRYDDLKSLAILSNAQNKKIARNPSLGKSFTTEHSKNIVVPLERIITGANFDENVPSWKDSGPKSLGEGRDYIKKSPLGGLVSTTTRAVAVEYALRNHGRKREWQDGVGAAVLLTPFIDDDGEVWFRAHNGNTRIAADKLLGADTIQSDIELSFDKAGAPRLDIYKGSVIAELALKAVK